MKGERKPQEYWRLWWKVEKKVDQIRRQYIFELIYPEFTYSAQQNSQLLPQSNSLVFGAEGAHKLRLYSKPS